VDPTSSPHLDHITATELEFLVFGDPFDRFSEAERWMRRNAHSSKRPPHPGIAHIMNSASPPPTVIPPNDTGVASFNPAGKLFVGNLPYECTNEALARLFKPIGEVLSAAVIMDRETQRSKGFGFVEMRTREEAERAVNGLDAPALDGRRLTVSFAHRTRP
jgi:hypothetical protein